MDSTNTLVIQATNILSSMLAAAIVWVLMRYVMRQDVCRNGKSCFYWGTWYFISLWITQQIFHNMSNSIGIYLTGAAAAVGMSLMLNAFTKPVERRVDESTDDKKMDET